MQNIYEVKYKMTDKGFSYPEKTKEVVAVDEKNIADALNKEFNKHRRAMCLSNKFSFEITGFEHIGWK